MNYNEVYIRMLAVAKVTTQVEIAEVLKVRQSSVSDAKRRDKVPAGWFLVFLEEYGINPAWLRTGQGPKYLVGTNDAPCTQAV